MLYLNNPAVSISALFKNKPRKRILHKFVVLLFFSTLVNACTSTDPNNSWTNILTWQSPVVIRTYEDYMAAAYEKVRIGDSRGAIEMYRMAVIKAQSEYGPEDLRIATSAGYLAAYCVSLGLLGDAETYYKKALAVDVASLGPNDKETIRVRNALIDVLIKLFKMDEANKLRRESKSAASKAANKH